VSQKEPISLSLPGFEPLTLNLGRRAIFVGPNCAGKTRLLSALMRHFGPAPASFAGHRKYVNGALWVSRYAYVAAPQEEAACEAVEEACRFILPEPGLPRDVPVTAPFVREIMRAAYSPHPVVFVDNLGEGLHIGAQYRLAKALKDAQEARPELRILYSTHSPQAILDDEPADNVFVVARKRFMDPDENPAKALTRVKSLGEYPDTLLRMSLRAADLWASAGEDWIWDHHDEGGD